MSQPPCTVHSIAMALAALLSLGCSDDGTNGQGGTVQRTLDNCETDIADDVPDFYKTYFRCVDIHMSGGDVVIHTTDLPPHPSAYYAEDDPNHVAFDTSGGRAPIPGGSGLVEQSVTVTIPTSPVAKGITIGSSLIDGTLMSSDEELPGGAHGVALNSVAFFSGAAGMGMNIADEVDTLDAYQAHHAMGTYHYHGQTPGPLEVLERAGLVTSTVPGSAKIEIYAVMCDGTLVLGCPELDGGALDDTAMDAQGGHVHDISDGAVTHFAARYHTHVCPGLAADFSPEIQYHTTCP